MQNKSVYHLFHQILSGQPFNFVHCDIWGPFIPQTVEGHRYFFSIVDDGIRFTWIYLLKQKSDVLNIFPDFYTLINTQFGAKIKSVRTDNALELAFIDFFRSKGIHFFHSCVDTPQQNSMVEHKHQHLLNIARALHFQSNVPLGYWRDCVLTFA